MLQRYKLLLNYGSFMMKIFIEACYILLPKSFMLHKSLREDACCNCQPCILPKAFCW